MPGMSPSPAVVSYTTVSPLPCSKLNGGLFSVALSLSLRTVAVSHLPALRRPDFPHADFSARDHLPGPRK